jgi:hypothetical protein
MIEDMSVRTFVKKTRNDDTFRSLLASASISITGSEERPAGITAGEHSCRWTLAQ